MVHKTNKSHTVYIYIYRDHIQSFTIEPPGMCNCLIQLCDNIWFIECSIERAMAYIQRFMGNLDNTEPALSRKCKSILYNLFAVNIKVFFSHTFPRQVDWHLLKEN